MSTSAIPYRLVAVAAAVMFAAFASQADARGTRTSVGGSANASRSASASSSANVNRSANVNSNTNVNRNVNVNSNVNVNRNVNVDVDNDWNDHYHPVARGVAVGTAVAVTAAAIGSVAYSIPPSCVPVMANNMTYQQCGSTWYAPQYAGSSVQYVVVAPPH